MLAIEMRPCVGDDHGHSLRRPRTVEAATSSDSTLERTTLMFKQSDTRYPCHEVVGTLSWLGGPEDQEASAALLCSDVGL